jgi:hypothetical protein
LIQRKAVDGIRAASALPAAAVPADGRALGCAGRSLLRCGSGEGEGRGGLTPEPPV